MTGGQYWVPLTGNQNLGSCLSCSVLSCPTQWPTCQCRQQFQPVESQGLFLHPDIRALGLRWHCGQEKGHGKLTLPYWCRQSRSRVQFLYLSLDGTSTLQTRHRCLGPGAQGRQPPPGNRWRSWGRAEAELAPQLGSVVSMRGIHMVPTLAGLQLFCSPRLNLNQHPRLSQHCVGFPTSPVGQLQIGFPLSQVNHG